MTVTDAPTTEPRGDRRRRRATTVHHRTCPLCEATCGLEITVRGEQVVRIRGDRDNPFSQRLHLPEGLDPQAAARGPRPAARPADPPGRRPGHRHLGRGQLGRGVRRDRAGPDRRCSTHHGRDAVALYLGNPIGPHAGGRALQPRRCAKALGTQQRVLGQHRRPDAQARVERPAVRQRRCSIPVPDLDRTDYLLMLGANPWESNGIAVHRARLPRPAQGHPGPGRQGRRGRSAAHPHRRGGRRARRHPTRHRRPPAGGHDPRAVRRGPGRPRARLAAPPRRRRRGARRGRAVHPGGGGRPSAASTPTTIRRLARELAAAPTAAVYGRIGTHTVEFGTVASWAVDVLNVLTGNLDRPGGVMFPLAAHDRADRARARAAASRSAATAAGSRASPRCSGEFPVATLADEIETPGRGPDPGADHRRRQPGAVHARQRPARRRARRARLHGQRRHLPQRDHPARQRDPAAAVAAGAQRVPPGLLRAGRAQLRRMVAADPRARRPRWSTRSWPGWRSSSAARAPTPTRRSSTT